MRSMLLATKGLTKHFGGLIALNDVDFQVAEGEIVAIIGPNGAGKSTFFNVISGFLRPTSGKIFFQDQEITRLATHRYARRGIARTFQTTRLFADSSVIDNVIIGHRLRTKMGFWDAVLGTPRARREEKECRDKAWAVLDFVGLASVARQSVASISQEARKRLAVGLALATTPRLLLLDEPTAGVNSEETNGLAELIKKIRLSGMTVCLIEHKMQMVMNLADRIVVLNYGSKIAEGTPQEISANDRVIEAYLGGSGLAEAQ